MSVAVIYSATINIYSIDSAALNIIRNWCYNIQSLGMILLNLQILILFRPIAKIQFIKPKLLNSYRVGLIVANVIFCSLMYLDYIAFDHYTMSDTLYWTQFSLFFIWGCAVYFVDGFVSLFLIFSLRKHLLTLSQNAQSNTVRSDCKIH